MEHKESGLRGVSDLGGVAVAGVGGMHQDLKLDLVGC